MVTGLFKQESFRSRLSIASDVLQIYSHNLDRNLLGDLESRLKGSKIPVGVIDKKIRSKVYKASSKSGNMNEVAPLFVPPLEKQCATVPLATTMKREIESTMEHRPEPDTAREAASDVHRTQGWDAFSKDKPLFGADISDDIFGPSLEFVKSSKKADRYLDTPLPTGAMPLTEEKHTKDGLFLTCFGETQKSQDAKTALMKDMEWTSPPPAESEKSSGAYLRLFGFRPVPDGPPVEWDLSQDAVLTQLRTYQEAVDRFRMPVPKQKARTTHSQVEWHHRTVFLDNLPRDVHPESLRRAFESMFGEIEEENGIILASARKSSIAYLVFKSLESAIAVGRADSWVTGSKIVIQKYQMPLRDGDSDRSEEP